MSTEQTRAQPSEREAPAQWEIASRLHLMLLDGNSDKLTRAERQTVRDARDALASPLQPEGDPTAWLYESELRVGVPNRP
jgi:hypothetical protein